MDGKRNICDAEENQKEPPMKKKRICEETSKYVANEMATTGGGCSSIWAHHILQASLSLLESSESESDSDGEMINTILNVHKGVNIPSLMIKESILLLQKKSRNCVKNYFEATIPSYTEDEFRSHFRISRSLYERLSENFAETEIYSRLRMDKRLSAKMYLAVFLWFAGHEACSYRDLADRFDLSLGTVWNMIHRVILYISSLSPQFIKWPNEEQKFESSKYFAEKCGFSKAIGCIDGTHVVIDPPKAGKDDYIDRKGNVSICLQAVCNEKKKFISIFVGYPGSSHDSWVFQNSPLYKKITSSARGYYLLGDSAYPCSSVLVTPYRDNGHLTSAQKAFNIKLSSGRVAIEHSFGILKQRFRQLYYCKIRCTKTLCHFIRSCCVLHNIANEDDLDFTLGTTSEVVEDCLEHGAIARGNAVRDVILREFDSL